MAQGQIRTEPLNGEDFAPFGIVLDLAVLQGRPVNENRGIRCDLTLALQHDTGASSPSISVYRLSASRFPFDIRQFECHPHSDQLFVPMAAAGFLVAVAPAGKDGGPDLSGIRAFVGRPGQAIVYRASVWHLPLVALEGEGTFLMQMWETGDAGLDCEVLDVPLPIVVTG